MQPVPRRNACLIVTVVALLSASAAMLINNSSAGAPEVKARVGDQAIPGGWQYQALAREQIHDLAPEDGEAPAGLTDARRAWFLTEGLNVLARDGWELVAVEPYHERGFAAEGGRVTVHHGVTYIFRRSK